MTEDSPFATLRRMPLLDGLSDVTLRSLAERGTRRSLDRGEILVQEGDSADSMHFILHGRFVVRRGDIPIAELSAGEPVGEIAFLAGGTRTATVGAMRASEVLSFDRAGYDALVRDFPDASQAVIRALARRVVSGNAGRRSLEPRAGAVICIRPVTDGALPDGFAEGLRRAAAFDAGTGVIVAADGLESGALTARISEAEAADRRLLLVVDRPGTPWDDAASAAADTVLLVADASRPPVAPRDAEAALLGRMLPQNLHLALLRDSAATPIRDTAAWLEKRPVGLHHHVARDRPADLERVARFLAGSATGVVFGGGAAFGCAHLGVLKALREHGFAVDMVGGASMGSAMAGGTGLGLSSDEIMDLLEELFLRTGAMKRYTVPLWSVIDHRVFDREVARLTRHTRMEDLELPAYAVASSLTDNALKLLRTGPLWKAIRASSAIPGVFPPMIADDGEVLIDGGLMDNAPLAAMRDLKPGRNIVLTIARPPDWRVRTPYERLPGRAGALRQMLPFGRKLRFPGIFSVLSRTMVLNSERLLAETERRDDVFLSIPPLPRMGFLEWEKGRALFERSYRDMATALEADGGTRPSLDRLMACDPAGGSASGDG